MILKENDKKETSLLEEKLFQDVEMKDLGGANMLQKLKFLDAKWVYLRGIISWIFQQKFV